MLNCEYCDYYMKARISSGMNDGKCGGSCEFSGHIFTIGEIAEASEHPCGRISYQDYLKVSAKRMDLSEAV
ncbi:MAG: hypothetical protein HGA22_05280 [Clostridiales bacterium]|nr:hypothetical protein [Clostridiales bacterium]